MEDFKCDRSTSRRFFKKCFYSAYRSYLHLKQPEAINILFYPQWPSWKSGIHKILMNLDIGITNNLADPFVKAFFWEDRTFRKRRERLLAIKSDIEIVNFNCTDVSKENVEKVFEDVFGYRLRVDPFWEGTMVRKSNFNSKHDGIIIEGPVTRQSGFVYEKLLNSETPDGLFQDMRITYFRGAIPFVSLRYHTSKERFGGVFKATVEDVDGHLTDGEQQQIRDFCSQLGLEYGDLDMIRDNDDGKLYILDANPTPSLPPRLAMEPLSKQLMVDKWSEAFLKVFLSPVSAAPAKYLSEVSG